MNKPTRFIIAVLTVIFLLGQIFLGIAFVNLTIAAFSVFFSGLSSNSSMANFILGTDMSHYNFSFLSERQFVLLIFLFSIIYSIGTFFLLQYLRTILLNLNEGEVFSEYNLKYIRRIMVLYLAGGIFNFVFGILPMPELSSSTASGTGGLIMGGGQVLLMTAGIYTLYFVFKYGVRLKKDNEEIV